MITNQTFTNNQLTIEQLNTEQFSTEQPPQVKELAQISLQPIYRKANFVIRLVVSLLLILAVTVFKYQTFSPLTSDTAANINWLLIALALICLYWLVFGYFSDTAKGYAIREQDLSFYSGVIFKKVVTQPLLRLQHIELKRGPVERRVDLATIQVFSAGGAQHTFELPGLSFSEAKQLRQFILDHKDVTFHE